MKSAAKKTYLHLAIAVVLFALVSLAVKPVNGLTETGVRVLAVTIPTLCSSTSDSGRFTP